jgi:hypothetical protein
LNHGDTSDSDTSANPNPMNHSHLNNDVTNRVKFTDSAKFTGSAFESPGDAATVLFQFVLLLMIVFGLVPDNRRN